jgi:hypothetical protein
LTDTTAGTKTSRWLKTAIWPVASVILFGLFIWLVVPPKPEILENLPATAPEIAATWTERMHARFPVGTPAADFRTQLTDWGFVMPEPLHFRIELAGAPCSDFFDVTWTADSAGNLTGIDPTHRQVCRP